MQSVFHYFIPVNSDIIVLVTANSHIPVQTLSSRRITKFHTCAKISLKTNNYQLPVENRGTYFLNFICLYRLGNL